MRDEKCSTGDLKLAVPLLWALNVFLPRTVRPQTAMAAHHSKMNYPLRPQRRQSVQHPGYLLFPPRQLRIAQAFARAPGKPGCPAEVCPGCPSAEIHCG